MEFCLFYQGELPSNGTKRDKHRIRTELAPQLKILWEQEPLRSLFDRRAEPGQNTLVRRVGTQTFLPIITDSLHLYAEISIDMLRPGKPGDLIQDGDIDNRLKTLFDALRMPNTENELVNDSEDGTVPLCCLLEDDRLITRIGVNTHQLLLPIQLRQVILLIHVVLKKTDVTYENIGL